MRSSRRMTRSSIVYGDTVLRSGRRLFATRELLDHEKQVAEISLGETDEVMVIDGEEESEINLIENGTNLKLGQSKDNDFVDGIGDKISRAVYCRKRKRALESNSDSKFCKFGKRYCGIKVRSSLGFRRSSDSYSGFDHGEDVLREGPIVFAGRCSYTSSCIYRFSCFVSSVLRYMRNAKVFSWRQFSLFHLSEPTTSIYSSIGCRFPKDSIFHGIFKVFGSLHSIPFFTVDFNALPFCFLYMHSISLLKSTLESYALLVPPIVENVTCHGTKVPYFLTTNCEKPFGHFLVAVKARSARRRLPRVSVFKAKFLVHVDNIVPVPCVRVVSGYAEVEYVAFTLPESYISFREDEVTRTLDKSYPIYDMDSLDEEWLKKFNYGSFVNKEQRLSKNTFEKLIGALEKGMYCSRVVYSNAASAVDRCLGLGSKEVVQAVYRYWMKKRKSKGSPLVRVFQCNPHKRGRKPSTTPVVRKKRSFRGRNSKRVKSECCDSRIEDCHSTNLSNVNVSNISTAIKKEEEDALEELRKAQMNAQEAAMKADREAIVKRKQAQELMLAADQAVYRATMLLKIADLQAQKKASNGSGGLQGKKGPRPTCVIGLPCVRETGHGRVA